MKKSFKMIFNRTALVALAIILQIAIIFASLQYFYEYYIAVQTVSAIFGALVLIAIINQKTMPEFKLSWMLVVLIFPLLGTVLYLMFSKNTVARRLRKHMTPFASEYLRSCQVSREGYTETEREFNQKGLPKYIVSSASLSAFGGTNTRFFPFGEEMYRSLIEDLKKAEKFIFMEYFIVEPGKMWSSIVDILEQKVKEGLDVRVLYDDLGSSPHVKSGYYKTLRKRGIKCYKFNKFIPVVSGIHNNRDHRKITVIDGQIGYTGGLNMADEYCNFTHPYGKWKDTAVRLSGKAVNNLTLLFLENYNMTAGTKDHFSDYLLAQAEETEENAMVQPFGDGPEPQYHELIAENAFLSMIENAKESVYITTPYLIIDYTLQRALCFAAKRGVDVQLITPGIPDKKLVYAVTRSNYGVLLKAGVKIYEYSPGFIHSKTVVADGQVAFCGTVNFDYRSLVHHFECGVLLYGGKTVTEMQNDFVATRRECREVPKNYRQNPLVAWICDLLTILTPLL